MKMITHSMPNALAILQKILVQMQAKLDTQDTLLVFAPQPFTTG
jgi:hypothetical protein